MEFIHEEVDTRPQVHLVLAVRPADLDDASALRPGEEENRRLFHARPRAVLRDIHDFLGLTACAGGRIAYARLVLANLNHFRHRFQLPCRFKA